MHRDRRRAGRAIRKSRRETRDQLILRGLCDLASLSPSLAEQMSVVMGRAFKVAGEVLQGSARTITLLPALSAAAVAASGAGTRRPSQSGTSRASEAHSAPEGVVVK